MAASLSNGALSFLDVLGLITEVSAKTDVVALGITEHLPWDAVNVQNMLARVPILAR